MAEQEIPNGLAIWKSIEAYEMIWHEGFSSLVDPLEDTPTAQLFYTLLRVAWCMQNVVELGSLKKTVPPDELETLQTMISKAVCYGRANILLVKSGSVAEAQAILRLLYEACNLIHLLVVSRDHYAQYLKMGEEERADEFKVGRVRTALELREKSIESKGDPTYGLLSRKYSHFGSSSIALNLAYPTNQLLPASPISTEYSRVVQASLASMATLMLFFAKDYLVLTNYPSDEPVFKAAVQELQNALENYAAARQPSDSN